MVSDYIIRVSNTLKQVRLHAGLSQHELSRVLNTSQARISRLEACTLDEVGIGFAVEWCKACNISEKVLYDGFDGDGCNYYVPLLKQDEIRNWDILSTNLSNLRCDKIKVPADIKRNSFAFKMNGNSMSSLKGKSISADTIIVASNVFKNSNESLNGKVVVALVNNSIYIREYVVEGDNAFLIAWNDNSVMYPPIQVNETVQVLARVQYCINQF